jgi:hypothetical protein
LRHPRNARFPAQPEMRPDVHQGENLAEWRVAGMRGEYAETRALMPGIYRGMMRRKDFGIWMNAYAT